MSSGVFANDGSYSYEKLQRYFEDMQAVPDDCGPILSYVKHLIDEQPDIKKLHALEGVLNDRITQVLDQNALVALVNQVSDLLHQDLPKSLVKNYQDSPSEVLELLWDEYDLGLKFDAILELAYLHPAEIMREHRFFLLFSDEQRGAIALACASKDPGLVLKKFHFLQVDDENQKLFLLKTILQSDWSQLPVLLENSHMDESVLKKLFIYCGDFCPRELLQVMDKFHITDKQFIKSQVMLLARAYPDLIFEFRSKLKWSLEESTALIRECIYHSVDWASLIEALVRLPQNELLEIINLEEDKRVLQAIAFACVRPNPSFLATHLKKFKIEDQKVLELLALKLAETNCKFLFGCFEAFGIEDSAVRFELAKKMLAISPSKLAQIIKELHILDERDRLALALGYLKHALREDRLTIIKILGNFEIHEPPHLLKLVNEAIQKFPEEIAAKINTFGIQDQDELYALAHLSIIQSNGKSITYIPLFKITDPNRRIALAEEAAKLNGKGTAHALLRLEISDPEAIVRIATCCAESNGEVFDYLDDWGIEQGSKRLQIALVCAKQFPESVIEHLDSIGIEDEQDRLQLAEACAKCDPKAVVQAIDLFQLKEESRLVIARLCVGPDFPMHVKKFKIADLSHRIELARLCIKGNEKEVVEYLDEFDIEDEALRLELLKECIIQNERASNVIPLVINKCRDDQKLAMAELCFAHDPHGLIAELVFLSIPDGLRLSFLKRYAACPDAKVPNKIDHQIEDPDSRVELAELYAQSNPNGLATQIEFFKIEDESDRFRIANICFALNPASIPQNIHHFRLNDAHLYELAITCAQSPESKFPLFFRSFNLKDPHRLVELVLLSAQHNGYETAQEFNAFEIKDPGDRLKIIQTIARYAPDQLYLLVDSSNIVSEDDRIALAKIAIISDPIALLHLHQFEISSEAEITELISLYARAFPEDFKIRCIHIIDPRFIKSEAERIRLAEIGCEVNPTQAIRHIDHFGIEDHQILIKLITKMALAEDLGDVSPVFSIEWTAEEWKMLYQLLELTQPEKYIEMVTPEQLNDVAPFAGCAAILKEEGNISSGSQIMKTHYPEIRTFLSQYPDIIEPKKLPEIGSELSPVQIKKIAITYLGLRLLSPELLQTPIIRDTFVKLTKHRNRSQALSYLALLAYGTSPEMIRALHIGTQMALKEGSREPFGKPLSPLLIPMLICAKWAGECQKPELLIGLNRIFRVPDVRKGYFKEEATASDSMMQVWLQTVQVLDLVKELSPRRKIQLLTQAASPIHALRDRLLAIQGVICSEQAKQLDRDFGPSIEEELKEIVKEGLLSDDYLALGEIDNLEQKFLNTLAKLRFPNAWKIYEKKLQEIEEHEADEKINGEIRSAYQRFIKGVLNGTFREERYATTSRHIETIRKEHEAVWLKWQQPDAGNIIMVDGMKCWVVNTDDWEDLLLSGTEVEGSCQRIDDSQQLNLGLLGYLLDGKIRMIAVKDDETGQICARALVRLMWDRKTGSPVLFLERKYPKKLSEQMRRVLDDYGAELARKLELPLYSWEPNQKSLVNGSHIVSMGSCAPYEYADSGIGEVGQYTQLMRAGVYSLTYAYPVDLYQS